MKHRLHVVSLPHTHTTREFTTCAFTDKARKFCGMMTTRGNEVYLYAGERNEALCTEHVPCINEAQRRASLGDKHFTQASFDHRAEHWQRFNKNVVAEIKRRARPHDIICLSGGTAHKPIADALPNLLAVEYGIGYAGTFARFRVFESYAWMHCVYGAQSGGDASRIDGRWFDAVIPGFIEEEDFPLGDGQGDDNGPYVAYLGRMIDRKGIAVAQQACAAAGLRLVTAGPGPALSGVEHLGEIGPARRAEFMGGATALIAPTIYAEPFGMVSVEAQACGTPVVATDWGAFPETVKQGRTGYRCRSLAEFAKALKKVHGLSRTAIRARALSRYSLGPIGARYQCYFDRLHTLWGQGWYELP
jgi:glycosyltransferase involved in cell wall biosynthesis